MKLGLIARADNTGLGMQTWEFYRHMQPVKTMVVDISRLNGNPNHFDRYPGARIQRGFPSDEEVQDFLRGLDVVFIAEASYNPRLYNIAREMGVKTAVQYNYEFMDWLVNENTPKPDMFIAPSKWHYDLVDYWCKQHNIQHVYLHCPVNREKLPHRNIRCASLFLHNAGKPAAQDRNGTLSVIRASKHLKSNAQIVIHFQGEQGLKHQQTFTTDMYQTIAKNEGDLSKIQFVMKDYDDYAEVYKLGDVLLLPRRYGGNCLPLNEALSVGMPVIMPDISPNNDLLPANWLVPAEKIGEFTPRTKVDIYEADEVALAAKIDHFANMTPSAMRFENLIADQIANSISWQTLKPEYERVLWQLSQS